MHAQHKAAFGRPPSADDKESNSDLWEGYSCPAGSCVIFTEVRAREHHKDVPH
jgi:hypothetical protein